MFRMEGPLEFSLVDTCFRESDKNDAFNEKIMQGDDHEPNLKGKSNSIAEVKDGRSVVGKRRKTLSIHQKNVLEMRFALSPYVSPKQQEELTVELGMTRRQLQFWFKNKRYRAKKALEKSTAIQSPQLNELGVDYDNLRGQYTLQPVTPMSHFYMDPAPNFYDDSFLW